MLTMALIVGVVAAIGVVAALVWGIRTRRQKPQHAGSSPGAPPAPQPTTTQTGPPVATIAVEQQVAAKWSELTAQLPGAILYDVDLEGGHVRWSDAFYESLGFERSEPSDTVEWWADHIHPDDAMKVNQITDGLNNPNANDWQVDYRFRQANDTYALVRDHATVLRNAQGEPMHIVGSLQVQETSASASTPAAS